MITIGVTGSIGMGKTTVTSMMKDMGIPVHNADAAVANFLGPDGIAVREVKALFPEAVSKDADGTDLIDKEILGKIVFYDREKKTQLEAILHPLVKTDSDNFVEEMKKQGHEMVAFEIPLLFETHRDEDMTCSICVSCSPENQKSRILDNRPGMTSEKFDAIVAGQMIDSEKRARADYVLANDGDFDEARENLERILSRISDRFKNQ